MIGVILAGGKGERLKPLTETIPKPMIDINGKPLVEHTIDLFKKYGINKLLFCLHYMPEKIIDYFGDGSRFDIDISYSIEKEPMGTAGALKISNYKFDDTFVVMYGDNFTNIDLRKLKQFHKKKNALATIALLRKKINEPSSSLIVIDKKLRVEKFKERPNDLDVKQLKGKFKYVNTGVYMLEPEVLKFIPEKKFDFGYDLFQKLLKMKLKIFGYVVPKHTYVKEIGTRQKLQMVRQNARL